MKTVFEPVQKACDEVGGQAELGRLIDAAPSFVSQWLNGIRPVPQKFCVRIEKHTSVTRKDLRPTDYFDLWPEIDDRKLLRRRDDIVCAATE